MAVTGGRERMLAAEQLAQFERDGFVVIDGACPPELVDRVRAEIDPLLHDDWDQRARAERDGVTYFRYAASEQDLTWDRLLNAWKVCDGVRELALLEPLLEMVERLHGRRVKPFQTLNFPIGTQQPAHADSFHFQSNPNGYMCGVWVALEDMDMDNGPLVYYPGSQKLPMPTWEVIEEATGYSLDPKDFQAKGEFHDRRHQQYADYCQWLIEHERLEPRYGTIRQGQALIWAANLLHGGSPQADHMRTRHSQVTHYFFEGCSIYTPMHVDRGHIYWEYPEWIRDPVPSYSTAAVCEAVDEHVPPGAHVLVVSRGETDLLDLPDYGAEAFPQDEEGCEDYDVPRSDSIEMLEALRGRGARWMVVPRPSLSWLEWAQPELQECLESRYRPVFADGSVGAIYSLE